MTFRDWRRIGNAFSILRFDAEKSLPWLGRGSIATQVLHSSTQATRRQKSRTPRQGLESLPQFAAEFLVDSGGGTAASFKRPEGAAERSGVES